MKLILILLSLAINHLSVWFDGLREFHSFNQYLQWMESRLSPYGIWNSTLGVLIPLVLPILIALLVLYWLNDLWFVFGLIFSLLILVLCLDREQLIDDLEDCVDGCRENDAEGLEAAASRFTDNYRADASGQAALFRGIFEQHQSKVLGVLFWFVILGVMGALLYRLSYVMYASRKDIHGGFASSARNLQYVLNWPVTRLSILSYALVGSLIDTLDTWRNHEAESGTNDDHLLTECGLAAMQYDEQSDDELAQWLIEIQGLMNRALVFWLVLVALVTISGWMA